MRRKLITLSAAGSLFVLAGCGDDAQDAKGAGQEEPAFALASSVFGAAGTATYISVLNTLDPQSIDLGQASEHPGFATISAFQNRLYVGDGAAPVISRFAVYDNGKLEEEDKLSFGPRGLSTAPLYFNTFIAADAAYVQHEQNKRVFWDPTAMELRGDVQAVPGLDEERDGLRVVSAYDRGIAVRGDTVFHPYAWTDGNYYAFAPTTEIAVFSTETGALVDRLEAPCPGLDFVTSDEAGDLYFSNWVFAAAAPVLDSGAPKTCAVRIRAGEREIDESWTRDLGDWVEGRQTAAFRYLGDSIGLLAVLHEERLEIDENTQPSAITLGSDWRLWSVNVETGASAPIEGIDWMAGGYYAFNLDGRTFLLLPSADYASTTVYELAADGSRATALYQTAGWAYQFVQVR